MCVCVCVCEGGERLLVRAIDQCFFEEEEKE